MKKQLALMMALTLCLQLIFPVSAKAASFNDISSVYKEAREAIVKWAEYGVIRGIGDGQFGPQLFFKRYQMAVMLERIMGYLVASDNTLTDMHNNTYLDAVLKCVEAGVFDAGGAFRPDDNITRAEAVLAFVRALGIDYNANDRTPTIFIDDDQIPVAMRGAINALMQRGILRGIEVDKDENGYSLYAFKPNDPIKRQDMAMMFSMAIEALVNKTGESAASDAHYRKTVVINTSGAVLNNTVILGDLIVAEGVGEGDVYLDNVTIMGELIVKAGGENSIHVNDSNISSIKVDKKGNERVSLKISGDSHIDKLDVNRGNLGLTGPDGETPRVGSVTMQTNTAFSIDSDVAVGTLYIPPTAANTNLFMGGTVDSLTVEASNVKLDITGGAGDVSVAGEGNAVTIKGTARTVNITGDAPIVSIEGDVNDIILHSPEIVVVVNGYVGTVTVAEKAAGTNVTVGEKGTVVMVVAEAEKTAIINSGTVMLTQVYANNVVTGGKGTYNNVEVNETVAIGPVNTSGEALANKQAVGNTDVEALFEKATESKQAASMPTTAPTATPTATPAVVSTATPTVVPTATPTVVPTATPTVVPTATPTVAPTATPTVVPTATPTVVPTATPTVVPTATPTVVPTATPTVVPTATPTVVPPVTISGIDVSMTAPKVGVAINATAKDSNNRAITSDVSYQWQLSPNEETGWVNATGAGNNTATYTPVSQDAGQYLRVIATGSGTATGHYSHTISTMVLPFEVAFISLIANGSPATTETTELTIILDHIISDLAAADITVTGAEKGLLDSSNAPVYKLTVTSITAAKGTNVQVALSKAGFMFVPANRQVAVHVTIPDPTPTASDFTFNGTIDLGDSDPLTSVAVAARIQVASNSTIPSASMGSITVTEVYQTDSETTPNLLDAYVSSGTYTAVFSVAAVAGVNGAVTGLTINFTINNIIPDPTPSASDFTFNGTIDLGGSDPLTSAAVAARIQVASGSTIPSASMGAITVHAVYQTGGETTPNLLDAYVSSGTYTAVFDVAAAAGVNEAMGLEILFEVVNKFISRQWAQTTVSANTYAVYYDGGGSGGTGAMRTDFDADYRVGGDNNPNIWQYQFKSDNVTGVTTDNNFTTIILQPDNGGVIPWYDSYDVPIGANVIGLDIRVPDGYDTLVSVTVYKSTDGGSSYATEASNLPSGAVRNASGGFVQAVNDGVFGTLADDWTAVINLYPRFSQATTVWKYELTWKDSASNEQVTETIELKLDEGFAFQQIILDGSVGSNSTGVYVDSGYVRGLKADELYKVFYNNGTNSKTFYVKSDGTLSTSAADLAGLSDSAKVPYIDVQKPYAIKGLTDQGIYTVSTVLHANLLSFADGSPATSLAVSPIPPVSYAQGVYDFTLSGTLAFKDNIVSGVIIGDFVAGEFGADGQPSFGVSTHIQNLNKMYTAAAIQIDDILTELGLGENDTITIVQNNYALGIYNSFDGSVQSDGQGSFVKTKSYTVSTFNENSPYSFIVLDAALQGDKAFTIEIYKGNTPLDENRLITIRIRNALVIGGSWTLTFSAECLTTVPALQTFDQSKAAERPTPDPEREGYTFLGWYTTVDGNEAWDFSRAVTGDMTLYAHWELNIYEVRFDANNGTNVPATIVSIKNPLVLPTPDPSRTGIEGEYTFMGWFDENGKAYDANKLEPITTDMTLYAHWQLEISGNCDLRAVDLTGVSLFVTDSCEISTYADTFLCRLESSAFIDANTAAPYYGTFTLKSKDGNGFLQIQPESGVNYANVKVTVAVYQHSTDIITVSVSFDVNGKIEAVKFEFGHKQKEPSSKEALFV